MQENDQTLEIHVLFKTLAKKAAEEWNRRSGQSLNLTQARMLSVLHYGGSQKVAELADQLAVTPGAITGIADKLIKQKLVDRRRDEQDRRVVYLSLTEQGNALIGELIEKQQAFYTKVVEHLGHEDVAHLKRILSEMILFIEQSSTTEKE